MALPSYIKKREKPSEDLDAAIDAATRQSLDRLRELRWTKQEHEQSLREIEQEIGQLEPICVTLMDQAGIQQLKIAMADGSLVAFSRTSNPHPKVEDLDALLADLRKRGLGSIIRTEVPWMVLRSQVKELEERGEAPLDGVNNSTREGVTVRRGTKKGGE